MLLERIEPVSQSSSVQVSFLQVESVAYVVRSSFQSVIVKVSIYLLLGFLVEIWERNCNSIELCRRL